MKVLYLLLSALLTPLAANAQTASLRGRVTDDSGAVVPAAKVTLSGQAGPGRTVTADNAGVYSFIGIAPGDYTVQAAAPELAQPSPSKISLKPGLQTLDLQLKVASLAQQVTVQDNSGQALSTSSASNASALVLRGDDLAALSDDPDDLQSDLQALAGPSAGPGGGAIFIDGFSGGEIPAKESIREIRINQNPFSPEYDKLGYGRIEIFTKPGSDKYRGNANYNLGTQAWNSRNPYSAQKAPFLLNEFEGGASGPLNKRSSFTLEAQRNTVDNGSISNGVTLDPKSLAAIGFNSVITTPQRFYRVTPRVDYALSENHTLTFRYGITHADIRDAGIGGFDLESRGYHTAYTNQTVQASETAVLGTLVNETRFQFYRAAFQQTANSSSPEIQVLGAFNGGGSQVGHSLDAQNNYELQNYTSTIRGVHSLRFGVRLRGQTDESVSPQNFNGDFTFGGGGLGPALDANNQPVPGTLETLAPLERYRRTLLFEQLGYAPADIRALGGGATQFTISAGVPALSMHQIDAGLFIGDEWRMRPNLTLSLGLRYETQTNISDHADFAPRIALAWAPGRSGKGARAKTVFRAGFGMFYDRFALGNTLTAQRYNGIVQQQYVVNNPDFYPNVPATSGLATTQLTEEISSHMRAPYLIQSALTLERQLPGNSTLAVTYTNSHGVHVFRSQDINAPLPGTYNPEASASGVFPLGRPSPLILMESAGLYNQNQLIANVNAKVNAGMSLFGFYVLNYARSNTDGINTLAANPYSFAGEYGPASTDVRQRVTVGGSISLKWAVRLNPFLIVQSGAPFDITAGSDLYGTTFFNGRPGVSIDPSKPGLIATRYGLLDPDPVAGEQLLGRNFGRGPALITANLRVAKTIGLGPERGSSKDNLPVAGSGGMAQAPTAGGRGLRGLVGPASTNHRYNLSLSMSIRNLLNHTNPGPIIGNVTSPLFARSNQLSGTPNGEGFYETANNRRLEMQIRFAW
jgi:hypothetical protein